MAKTEKIYNMQQILEELKSSHGLPENLSTEAQLWDEIMKKEAFLMPEQLFPLIREIHGKAYPIDTAIKPLATEYSVERSDTKEITSIRADITLMVENCDIYHFECEIKNDSTMVIRMFEYDVHIALSYRSSPLILHFPHSAVLYLQDNGNIPDSLLCQIHFQDGGIYEYAVPTVKVQTYSLEEIKEKHLCVLIPFLPLRFRKKMRSRKNSPELPKEELTSFYQQLILILDEEVAGNHLSENNRNIILNLLNKSMIRVFYKNEALLKEVVAMTEPILELEIEKYIRSLDEKQETIAKMEAAIAEKNAVLMQIEADISQKDADIAKKDAALSQRDADIAEKDAALSQKDADIAEKDAALSQKDADIAEKDAALSQKDADIAEKDAALSQKDADIASLKKQLAELRKSQK